MLAPLGASLNVLAARKMLMSVLTLTEEAGALSRSEAEALRNGQLGVRAPLRQ